jgi:hypothetical protein
VHTLDPARSSSSAVRRRSRHRLRVPADAICVGVPWPWVCRRLVRLPTTFVSSAWALDRVCASFCVNALNVRTGVGAKG